MSAARWPLVCGICERSYGVDGWLDLPIAGKGDGRYRGDHGQELEMRNCTCGGSHSVLVADLPSLSALEVDAVLDVCIGDQLRTA